MKIAELQTQLDKAQATVDVLQEELAETNRGLVALALELEKRVDERTAELRAAHEELQKTNSELMRMTLELDDRVTQRTDELNAANEVLRQSRIAALNMMEDAIAAQERIEQANAALQREVGQRKQAEQEIRQLNAELERRVQERTLELSKLSRATEESPAIVFITDKNGTIEYVNPKFVQATGYAIDEAMGQTPRLLKSGIHPREFYETMWKTILSGESWHGELCNRRKTGELYWESASISSLRNTEGIITHFVCVKEDISERKRAEEVLREAHELLQRQAADLKAFNQAMVDREQRIIEMKEEVNALCQELGREPEYPPVWKERQNEECRMQNWDRGRRTED